MKKTYTESEATCKAETLCSTSEQCVSKIREKLAKWGQSPDVSNRIIDTLVREKYIDERRFAQAFAHDKFYYNGWGKIKISHQLRQLGLSATDCKKGIDTIEDEDYQHTLTELLLAKSQTIKATSAYERNEKLIRFALGRGFEMEEIMRFLTK